MATIECSDHDMHFTSRRTYLHHLKYQCDAMLLKRNICVHRTNGKKCRKTFFSTTALIIHYLRRHRKFLCIECLNTYHDEEELENHIETQRQCELPIL